jgi:hypothetical protein
MAVKLRNRLTRGLALEKPLPASMIFDHPTLDALSLALLDMLSPKSAQPVAAPAQEERPQLVSADAVAAMSDADIAALLAARMERGR